MYTTPEAPFIPMHQPVSSQDNGLQCLVHVNIKNKESKSKGEKSKAAKPKEPKSKEAKSIDRTDKFFVIRASEPQLQKTILEIIYYYKREFTDSELVSLEFYPSTSKRILYAI